MKYRGIRHRAEILRVARVAVVLAVCLAGVGPPVTACGVRYKSFEGFFQSTCALSTIVCIADVIDRVPAAQPTLETPRTYAFYRLHVLQAWKGVSPDTLWVRAPGTLIYTEEQTVATEVVSSEFTITPGGRYLVYVGFWKQDGFHFMWQGTKPLDTARADLYHLARGALPVTRAATDPTVVPRTTIRALLAGLAAPDSATQVRAVVTLKDIGDSLPVCLPAILQCIRETRAVTCREAACAAIQTWSGKSADAAGAYLSLLEDPDRAVRLAAVRTYTSGGSVKGDDILIDAIACDPDPRIRVSAARWAERGLDRGSSREVNALLGALDDPEPRVRQAAASSLGAIRFRSAQVVDALWQHVRERDQEVARAAFASWQTLTRPRR